MGWYCISNWSYTIYECSDGDTTLIHSFLCTTLLQACCYNRHDCCVSDRNKCHVTMFVPSPVMRPGYQRFATQPATKSLVTSLCNSHDLVICALTFTCRIGSIHANGRNWIIRRGKYFQPTWWAWSVSSRNSNNFCDSFLLQWSFYTRTTVTFTPWLWRFKIKECISKQAYK